MNKIGLIIKREYLQRVSKKSFILLTFLTPFLFVALIFVPLWLSTIKTDEVRQVVIIDQTGKYAPLFENTESYHFLKSDQRIDEYKQNSGQNTFAILSITDDLLQHPSSARLYSEKQIPSDLSNLVNHTIREYLRNEKLESFNIPNIHQIIRESEINFSVNTIKRDVDGTEQVSSSTTASMVGIIFTTIVYMFIITYGAMVMQGVMQEKTNRIIEVMVSSVRPFDLMMGKIVGIGLVGLTQFFLWGILTVVLVAGGKFFFLEGGADAAQTGATLGMLTSLQTINFAEIGFFFVIFFIGGFLLYAALFAAIGSAVDSQEDTQQFMVPVMVFMIFAFYAGIYSMENPDGPLAFWCSMIPFTSPIVMMVRLPFEIPMWEKLVSIIILYASAIGIVWISAKIYRIGILMYGKKPSIKEIIKWIQYK